MARKNRNKRRHYFQVWKSVGKIMADNFEGLKKAAEAVFDKVGEKLEGKAEDKFNVIKGKMEDDLDKLIDGTLSKPSYDRLTKRRLDALERLANGAMLAARKEWQDLLKSGMKELAHVLLASV